MDNFPKITFKNLEGWIPESDADGVDVDSKYVSDMHALRFGNGYVENNVSIETLTLPLNVSTLITNGYDLKSSFNFTHSTQGEVTIYVLYKSSAISTEKLKVYIDNSLVQILDNNAYVNVLDAPNNINYNVINDEVKINLNCNATFFSKNVILNLSLQYLPEIVYSTTSSIKRLAGWYICPRWLGWQYNNQDSVTEEAGLSLLLLEDFEDTTYNLGININNWTRSVTARKGSGYGLLAPTSTILPNQAKFTMSLDNPYILSMYIRTDVNYVNWSLIDESTKEIVPYLTMENVSEGFKLVRWLINKTGTGLSFSFNLGSSNYVSTTGTLYYPSCHIDDISYTQTTDTIDNGIGNLSIVLTKFRNGERALVSKGGSFDINGISINQNFIDWRITSFELYQKDLDINVWYLKGEKYIDGSWIYNNSIVKATIPNVLSSENSSTLDFRYNLPYDSRVDNQSYIYMEVSHKGRVYYIKEDFKVYQSHIAGNGVLQPDSFPYDEEQGFGYFVVSRSRKNIALAVSPTNDLIVFTNQGFYVYFIQPSGSTVYRQLRMVSGSVGISSRKSLAVNNEGNPATQGLLWIDNNGIYFYSGGVTEPKNLLLPGHSEWWRGISSSYKSSIVGFYDSARYEYSFEVNEKLVNFEIPYNRFRISNFFGINEVIGYKNNQLYFRQNNIVYRFIDTMYSDGYFITHYNSIGEEIDDKVSQEIYVLFGKETNINTQLRLTIYIDNDIVIGTYTVILAGLYWKRLLPIRKFRRIKVKCEVINALRVKVREIGISYAIDKLEAVGVLS